MATIGILRTNAVDGGTFFYVDWKRTSYSIADNTSTVDWALYIRTVHNYYSNAVRNYGVSINGVQVFGGGVWSNIYSNTNTQLASGTITIAHDNDGTKTFNINTSGWVYENYNMSGNENFTLNSIPRQANLTNAENFTDEENPTITYSNPAGNAATSLQARIENTNGTASIVGYRDVSKTENSYTFPLTTTERNALRNATPNNNTMTVRFNLKTVIGGNTFNSTLNRTLTIVDANPTFSNFTYEDVNTTTTALTGNNQICVLGYSNIKAIISTSNKATANKGATMSKYQFVIGNTTKDIAYSSSSEVNATINNVTSGTMTVYAIDSRGNSKPVPKTSSTIKNYSNIYLNANNSNVERSDNGVGGQGTLHYEGTFWNENFGSVTNTIKSVSYEYKKTSDSTYTTGATDITPTISGNNLSFTGVIKGPNSDYTFDVDSSYNVRVTITDELSSYTINLILNSGTPNIAYADDGVAIMGDYDETIGNSLQVKGSLTASTLKEKNYQVTPININGSTSTLLSRVQDLAQKDIYEATWFTTTDGGSSGISDKPTGSTNGSFVCKAICNRLAGSNDWRYILNAYVQDSKIYYSAIVNSNTSSIVWTRPLQNDNYSTSETIIGTWITGKPIYRKVIEKTISSVNNTYSYSSLSLNNLKNVIKLYGISAGNPIEQDYYEGSADRLRTFANANGINVNVGSSYPTRPFTVYIIIEYTKTID